MRWHLVHQSRNKDVLRNAERMQVLMLVMLFVQAAIGELFFFFVVDPGSALTWKDAHGTRYIGCSSSDWRVLG